jgi:hypothetical protein
MTTRSFAGLFRITTFAFACLSMGSCRREQPKVSLAEVERCERGIEGAVAKPDVKDALRTYYRECAGVYAEAACKQAFTSAADLDVSEQMPKVVTDCRTAYCPFFQARGLEICQPTWQLSQVNIVKSWPALHDAILARDAKGYAPRISRAMLVFYSRVVQRMGALPQTAGAEPAPSAAAPSGSGSVAPAVASMGAALPVPSASAAPAVASGSANKKAP